LRSRHQPGAGRIGESVIGKRLREGVAQRGCEPGGLRTAGQVVPDGAEDAEVVGVGQLCAQGLGRGQGGSVLAQHVGERCYLVPAWLGVAGAGSVFWGGSRGGGHGAEACMFPGELAGTGAGGVAPSLATQRFDTS